MPEIVQSSYSRVFIIEDRAGPSRAPVYQGWWRAGAVSWGQGDMTLIYEPSSTQYDQFNVIAKVPGEPTNPTLAINARYSMDLSSLLRMVRNGCDNDVQVHFGKCHDPRDFNGGWEKILVLEAGRITDYGTDDLGALEPSQRAVVNENVTFTGSDIFEIKRILFGLKASTEVVREVVDVEICDTQSCGGDCGAATNGCQIVFVLTLSTGASPGIQAQILYTEDAGATWGTSTISTLSVSEDPSAMDCVGNYLVVVSQASGSLHYVLIEDLLDGIGVWAEIATGIVGGGEPNAIYSLGPTFTWVVGQGGYIYFSEDATNGVTVQDSGAATTENLLAVHAYDELSILAVGANNAVVYSVDGGVTWNSVTGPAPAIQLNTCWMMSRTTWWVGTNSGRLYYTTNSGITWTEKTFPGSGAGSVQEVKFSSNTVGWLAHTTAAPAGRILRTVNGGYSWYVAPEGTAVIPANQGINALAVCEDMNTVWGGGVTVVAGDGIVVASS